MRTPRSTLACRVPRVSRLLPLTLSLWLGAAVPSLALAQGLPSVAGDSTCKNLVLNAHTLDCQDDVCTLTGEATVWCDTLRLWADTIHLQLTPEREFAGAVAVGNVLLVDGNRLVTCNRLTLGADRIQGRIEDAVIEVKKGKATMPVSLVPTGRNQAVLTGHTIDRLSTERLHLADASFTLCDCEGGAPSWKVTSTRIDATLNERVTIYWPVFRVNVPFTDVMLPILPPLAPLSLPLKNRAAGLLPPGLGLAGLGWPTLDFPFFIPLGPAWDLTLTPGIRMDYSEGHRPTPPSTWGAPRLAARLRYAPVVGTKGELNVRATFDRKHGMLYAKGFEVPLAAFQTCVAAGIKSPKECRATDPLWGLSNRVQVTWDHTSDLSANLRLLTQATWVSDDIYPSAFALPERFLPYLPSRAELAWRSPSLAGLFTADVFEQMGNTPSDYLNVGSVVRSCRGNGKLNCPESYAPARGPGLRLVLTPTTLGAGVLADGGLSLMRFGPLDASAPVNESPRELSSNATAGVSYADRLGPLALASRAGVDWVGMSASAIQGDAGYAPRTLGGAIGVLAADVTAPFGRAFTGGWQHVVTPRLAYRSIPWRQGDDFDTLFTPSGVYSATDLAEGIADGAGVMQPLSAAQLSATGARLSSFDEVLRRNAVFHQALLSVQQDLSLAGLGHVAGLALTQPVDVMLLSGRQSSALPAGAQAATQRALMPTRLSVDVAWPRVMTAGAASALYVPTAAERQALPAAERHTIDIRELSVWASGSYRSLASAGVTYTRNTPRMGRIHSIYELEAQRLIGGAWVHSITFSATLRLPPRLYLAWSSAYELFRPGDRTHAETVDAATPVTGPAIADPNDATKVILIPARQGFRTHSVTLGYHSPCDCWDLSVIGVIPDPGYNAYVRTYWPKTPLDQLRIQFTFALAGYSIGTGN